MKKIWNFFLGFITIASFTYAIYLGHFKNDEPDLIFDILSNTEVLSINEDINNLQILFNGDTLNSNTEKLYILTIRIKNSGNDDVRESDYFSGSPFGFKIENGTIVENPKLIDASSNFLLENLSLKSNQNKVEIDPIPINQDQYFTIKVLSIANTPNPPGLKPIGMVSGIDGDFTVTNTYIQDTDRENFNTVNLYEYLKIAVFSIFITFLLTIYPKIHKKIIDLKRQQKISKFKLKNRSELNIRHKIYFFMIYKFFGKHTIFFLNDIFHGEKERKLLVELNHLKKKGENLGFIALHKVDSTSENLRSTFKTFEYLVKEGLAVYTNDNDLAIDQKTIEFLNEFNTFINPPPGK